MGGALSGASIPAPTWAGIRESIEDATGGELVFEHELARFARPVNARMEMLGVYRKDGRTLHIDDPVRADVHVNVWTDVPGSEGFVYERVLRAIDEAAVAGRFTGTPATGSGRSTLGE
jgi:hypothetical protein